MKNNRHSYNLIGISGKTKKQNALFENSIGEDASDNESEREWLNSQEAAEYLRVSEATLRNMTSDGKIPFHKLERRNRYRKSELRDLLLRTRRGGL